MMRTAVALASVLILSSSTAAAEERVFLIGDSQAFLLQHDLAPLVRKGGASFGASPAPGSSIWSWVRGCQEQKRALRRFKPTTILVSLGSNDAYVGVKFVASEREMLLRLLKELRRVAPRVIWLGPPKLPRAKTGLESFYQMVSVEVSYLDARTIEVAQWDDQLHCARPNPNGCVKWASWIWDRINSMQSSDPSQTTSEP